MIAGDLLGPTPQQIGRVAEYMARTEFTRQGYAVYVSDMDDHGVDMLVHRADKGYVRVQVKSLRTASYVFMRKAHFQPVADMALCLVLIRHGGIRLYLIPATRWLTPDAVFVSRDYEGLKSEPEYGLSLSRKGLEALAVHAFAGSGLPDIAIDHSAT